MSYRFKPELVVSEKLLSEICKWEIVDLPNCLFHGCLSVDGSVNIEQMTLVGDKWFSTNKKYAGSYAWHISREENPEPNSRYCLELHTRNQYKAIARPEYLKEFPMFLKSCFPQFDGYNLSRQFQYTLKLHLNELFGKDTPIIGYYWPDSGDSTDEICIPECHNYLDVINATQLPDDKQEFNKLYV